jgi:CHAT domain-containing protein
MVDIARIRDFNFRAVGQGSGWGEEKYVAWITYGAKNKTVKIVELGSTSQIDALIALVRNKLQSRDNLNPSGEAQLGGEMQSSLRALSDRIWKPIERNLSGVENVVLSPDGMSWLVPWSALPIGSTPNGPEFLIEEYNLRLVNSARDLLLTPSTASTSPPVVFANPSFDQNSAKKRESIQRLTKDLPEDTSEEGMTKGLLPRVKLLPNTEIEADAIKPKIQAYASLEPIVRKKGMALEHAVKKLKSPKIAAFATHGFFLPEQEVERKHDRFTSTERRRSVVLDKNNKPLENPLLRCGLLLAGCNDRNSVVGDDDGILTGMEITGIDFRGTELVVLSACDTGVGDIRNGEGVAGLRQAFQLAGAESVLASLWQVDDTETARLMNLFFDNLAKGMTKSEALRQSQLSRIRARRARHGAAHPFFWAAFTLTGQD